MKSYQRVLRMHVTLSISLEIALSILLSYCRAIDFLLKRQRYVENAGALLNH